MENLATELFQFICSYVQRQDLENLALASHTLAKATQPYRFETVDVILWKAEWSTFMDFLNRGGYLHGHVRQLRFHVQSPEPEIETMVDTLDWGNWMVQNFGCSRGPNGQQRTEDEEEEWVNSNLPRLLELHEKSVREYKERKEVIETAFRPQQFRQILQKLKNVNSLMLVTDGLGNQKREGRRFIEETHGTIHISGYHPRGSQGAWVAQRPINRSRYLSKDIMTPFILSLISVKDHPIKELDIGDVAWYFHLCPHSDALLFPAWKQVLEGVEKLSLFFSAAYPTQSFLPSPPSCALISRPVLQNIVGQASCVLQELRIGWHRDDIEDMEYVWFPCEQILELRFPRLRVLAMCGFMSTSDCFEDFLQGHSKTLHQFDLHDVLISNRNVSGKRPQKGFIDFVVWITRNMNLRRCSFSGTMWTHQQAKIKELNMDVECKKPYFNPRRGRVEGSSKGGSEVRFGLQIGLAAASSQPPSDIDAKRWRSGRTDRKARVKWIKQQFESMAY